MSEPPPDSPYVRLGHEEGVRALVDRFYEFMDTLPEAQSIRAMHADDLEPVSEKLAVFLVGWMGGPQRYREIFGRIVIPAAHEPYPIGTAEADAWLLCMRRALESTRVDPELLEMLMDAFTPMARMCQTRD